MQKSSTYISVEVGMIVELLEGSVAAVGQSKGFSFVHVGFPVVVGYVYS